MSERTTPPFRADHVGSLIRPDVLIDAREATKKGEKSETALREIQQAAIRDVVKMQESVGLKVVTDGEYNRQSWQTDFLLKFSNVKLVPSKNPMHFHTSEGGDQERRPPTLQVAGKLGRPTGIFVDDFKFLKSVAKALPKITMPSPSTMHFRGGREAIDEKAYPDMAEFYSDLARVYREEIADLGAAGCRYLQIDEVNLAYLCDPSLRQHVRTIGEDPASLPKTYAALINASIESKPKDMTVCMHLCRGNFAGAWVAEGGYDPIAEMLFNDIKVDGYFLEYDSPRAGSFEALRFLPKGKIAVLGLVTTKRDALETKDALKKRIEEAAKYAPIDQLALSPQCGFSSGIGGNTMTIDDEIKKLELVVDVAREVWGAA